jgi:hypothetical protein
MRLPGENSWETWVLDGKGAWQRAGREEPALNGLFGIDLLSFDSAPFWVPTAALDRLAETVALRWESLGLEAGSMGRSYAYWQVAAEADRHLIGTVALAGEAREEQWAKSQPAAFEISTRLFPVPGDEAVLWQELGRYVLVVPRGGQLLHTAVLAARALDATAAREVREILAALEIQGLLSPLHGVRVWTPCAPEFLTALQAATGVAARSEARPSPHPPHEPSHILPPQAAQSRLQKKQRQRQAAWLTATALLVALTFAAWAGWLLWRQQHLDATLARLAVHQPEVARIREAQLQWRALEPATDPETYPVEIYHRIVSLLPEEGIRFLDFSMDLEQIVISGEASSAIHASKFQEDLKASPDLEQYVFSTPVPSIRPDNRALFRVEAMIEGGGTE